MATFSDGDVKFYFSRLCQEFAFIAFGPRILPIRTALIPRSLADRVGFRIQKRIQRILDRLSNVRQDASESLFRQFSMVCFPFF